MKTWPRTVQATVGAPVGLWLRQVPPCLTFVRARKPLPKAALCLYYDHDQAQDAKAWNVEPDSPVTLTAPMLNDYASVDGQFFDFRPLLWRGWGTDLDFCRDPDPLRSEENPGVCA